MTQNPKNAWLESRQSLITATDSLFILKEFNEQLSSKLEGVNTWSRTRFQIYTEKTITSGQYCEYQNLISTPAMEEGRKREAEIAEFAKSDLGLELVANGDNVITKDEYKIGATPDYYAELVDPVLLYEATQNKPEGIAITGDYKVFNLGKGVLECKLTYEFTEDKLLGYEFQVQHQLLCTGLQWAVIAIGIKESREINSPITKRRYHFIKANPKIHQAIIDGVANFCNWFEDVKTGKTEAPQWDRRNEKDAVLFNIVRDDIEKLAEEYLEAQEAWKHWEYVRDILKDRMQGILGRATNDMIIDQTSGQKIKITQVYTKDTFYTEKCKEKAIEKAIKDTEKAQLLEIGSLKTPSKLHKFSVEII